MSLVLLAAAACLHAGFQLTVTLLVYPALARAHAVAPEQWRAAHEAHSRRIAPLVAVVYGACLAAGAGVLVEVGSTDLLVGARAGALGAVATLLGGGLLAATALVTALVAAPAHGRLGRQPMVERTATLRRLLAWDRVRSGLAVVAAGCLVAAAVAS